jgi:triosephosphate isomerase
MRRKLVAGNWKMHGSLAANQRLLEAVREACGEPGGAECVVCVPFPYLAQAASVLGGTPVAWGGQNVSEHDSGAYTGEVSGAMLRDFGCRYAIVGHSERRSLYGERDSQVAAKFQAAQRAGLTPILCVGETLEEREAERTLEVVGGQVRAAIEELANNVGVAVVAYEPVWAIGTGKVAEPQDAQDVHAAIREILKESSPELAEKTRILYGGSVKPQNAEGLLSQPDIDGALVGGAALKADSFGKLVEIAAKLAKQQQSE